MPSKHVLFAVSYQWIKYIANLLPRHALPLAAYLSWDNLCLHCHFSNLKWITALNTRAMKYSDASSAVMNPDEHVLNTPSPHLRSCHEGIQCPIYGSWCPFDLSFFFFQWCIILTWPDTLPLCVCEPLSFEMGFIYSLWEFRMWWLVWSGERLTPAIS